MYKDVTNDLGRQVQAMMCLKAFDDICNKVKGQYRIVPLKGIDLLRFLYCDTLNREIKDIDLLVFPAERAIELIELLQKEGYRPEFSFALDRAALNNKKKVSMISPSGRMPNVDIHLALITKKFFSPTINCFNQDAISRTSVVNDVVSVLDDVDRWLFLSTHLTFHYLEGGKWYRDLALLLERFDDEQISAIQTRAKQYNLERIVGAVCFRLQLMCPAGNRIDVAQLLPDKSGQRFLRYIDYVSVNIKRFSHGIKLGRYYWEFMFISHRKDRCHSYMHLIFPTLGNVQNIYRCHAPLAIALYLPHLLLNIFGVMLFSFQYFVVTLCHVR